MAGKKYIELYYDTQQPTGRILHNKDIPADKLDIPHKNISLRELIIARGPQPEPPENRNFYEPVESAPVIDAITYTVTISWQFKPLPQVKQRKRAQINEAARDAAGEKISQHEMQQLLFFFVQSFVLHGNFADWPAPKKSRLQNLATEFTEISNNDDNRRSLLQQVVAANTQAQVIAIDHTSGWV